MRAGPREVGLSVFSLASPAFSLLAVSAVPFVRAMETVMLRAVCGKRANLRGGEDGGARSVDVVA